MTRRFEVSRREAIVKALMSGAETSRDVAIIVNASAMTIAAELGAMAEDGRVERMVGSVANPKGRPLVRWRARRTA